MNALELLQSHAVVYYGVVGFISLCVGSFLNVVIHRLPIMMERDWRAALAELDTDKEACDKQDEPEKFNLSVPRSRCPKCDHQITAAENIPVLSYLALRGKCSDCKSPISARYPIIEIVTMLLSLLVAWRFGPSAQAVVGIMFTWALVALTMIDFDHQLLPDSITLPLMWLGIVVNLFAVFTDLHSSVVGAAVGYLSLWSIFHLFKLITGKEGMGYGDFKLLAAIGALLGWQMLPSVILLSSLVGAVVGISMIIALGRDKNIPIPFGPYLAAAGWLALIMGEHINETYLGLFA